MFIVGEIAPRLGGLESLKRLGLPLHARLYGRHPGQGGEVRLLRAHLPGWKLRAYTMAEAS